MKFDAFETINQTLPYYYSATFAITLNRKLNEPDQNSQITPSTTLVTGGSGFIGTHLIDALIDRGEEVTVIDNLSTSNTQYLHPDATLIDLDICDPSIPDLIADLNPKAIYHLAAQASVAISAREPLTDVNINVNGTLNLLEGIRELPHRPRFIFFSTGGAVYGDLDPSDLPASETIDAQPLSPYAVSKLAIEHYLRVYGHLYDLNYTIVRPANVYGPRQNPHGEAGVIAIFTQAMLESRQITIFGDGNDQRDYIYIADFIDGVLTLADSNLPGPYNIGTGYGISVNEIHNILSEFLVDAKPPQHGPPRPGDIPKIWLDVTSAENDLGWQANTSFQDGISKTVEWFRQKTS